MEANQLKIHFPRQVAEAPDAYEEITISTNDGKRTASTIICLSRTFKDEGQPDPEPEPLPEEAKFKMKKAYFTPFMHLDTQFPAPLDPVTFRITDINDNYTPLGFPEFTQYYDSIIWSAESFPHTFRVYESKQRREGRKHILLRNGVRTSSKAVPSKITWKAIAKERLNMRPRSL